MGNFKPGNYLLLLSVLVTVFVCVGLAGAHGDEKHDDSTAVTTPETTLEEQARIELDSLYSVINTRYQPLKPMLKKSCFDCHSTQTDYPWYHNLPIVKGMIDDHIKHAQEHVDFSNDFPFSGKESLLEILKEMREEVDEGEMPLWSYRLMHWGTLIEGAKQDSLFNWIDSSSEMMKSFYLSHGIPIEEEEDDH